MRQFVELEPSGELLSGVDHDLGFILLLAASNGSCEVLLLFCREYIVAES